MKQPPGFVIEGKEDYVLLLDRSIYGLKQSARNWNETVDHQSVDAGYRQLESDTCFYTKVESPSRKAIFGLHVDDIKYAVSRGSDLLDKFLAHMAKSGMKIKNLGPIRFFLGVEFIRQQEELEIVLMQQAFIDQMLERYRFAIEGQKGRDTPFRHGFILTKADSPAEDDTHLRNEMNKHPYQPLLGSLMYLAIWTRLDISYAINTLSQFSSNPGPAHWEALKHLIRYVRKTRDYGLTLGGKGEMRLSGFSDADWASNVDHHHSISGNAFFLSSNSGAISWSSKKQPTVALSSAESEYMALGRSTQETLWLRSFLDELGYPQKSHTVILSDNIGAIQLSDNNIHHQRTRHIDVRHHFLRKHVKAKEISPEYIPTDKQTADIFTKGLPKVKHEVHTKSLGLSRI